MWQCERDGVKVVMLGRLFMQGVSENMSNIFKNDSTYPNTQHVSKTKWSQLTRECARGRRRWHCHTRLTHTNND